MKNVAVIVAGGMGNRMKSEIPKQFIKVNDKEILALTIEKFEKSNVIDEIILVLLQDYIDYTKENILDKYNFKKVVKCVAGGKTRSDSVYNGLLEISDCDYVFIHDAARPFIEEEQLIKLAEAVREYKAVSLGVRLKNTIKKVDKDLFIEGQVDRELLVAMQTPQVFDFALIKDCYEKYYNDNSKIKLTDDTSLVSNYSDIKVKIIEGLDSNIKITTKEDLEKH